MLTNSINSLKTQMGGMLQKKTPLEKALADATSNENWGCSTSKMAEIAEQSYNSFDAKQIMKALWSNLDQTNKRHWRRVTKTLALLDYLIRNGSDHIVDETREQMFRIRTLFDYHVAEEGKDKGGQIRSTAKLICELVSDAELLREERAKAEKMRGRYDGISSKGAVSGMNKGAIGPGGRSRYDPDDRWRADGVREQYKEEIPDRLSELKKIEQERQAKKSQSTASDNPVNRRAKKKDIPAAKEKATEQTPASSSTSDVSSSEA
eukprot:GHVL01040154.1.p1 GENE.GHVL01040154.1~~GHVL01040154.1.p1  ORF type:complete len:264 (+),score=53.41 GHVL01040154.1:128-919(+)